MIFVRGLAVVLFACVCWRHCEASNKTVVGVVGGNITLKCDIPRSDPPVVSWVDWVFNLDHEPQPIFSSGPGMDDSHAYREHLSVNLDDFSLTISNLRLQELCAGRYICRSEVNGKTEEQSYNLVVRGTPQCRGDSQLSSGESTKLICKLPYSGALPALTWTRDGEVVTSEDESDIGLSVSSVSVDSVGPDDDKAVYRCEMRLADVVVHRHSVTLDVAYGAMDVQFTPNATSLSVGEELRCSARGNPRPDLELSPATLAKEQKSGEGWRSLVVQADWVGRTLTVECTASNGVDGELYSLTNSVTFNVTENASTQESTSDNTAVFIGLAIFLVVLLAVAAVVAIICISRRQRSKKPPKGSKPIPTKDDTAPEYRGTNGQTATA